MRWPGQAAAGAALTFDVDGESAWLSLDPANARRPSVLAQGAYGPRVALPLLLDLLHRHEVKATFFVPGVVAERHRDRIERIVDDGHEIALHGYTHSAPAALGVEEERAELERSRAALETFGATVVGYRAPHADVSESTVTLLDDAGLLYASNFVDDIQPYRHAGVRLIELPIDPILNDWPHFSGTGGRSIRSTADVREVWAEEIDALRAVNGSILVTMHPQMIGRPARLKMLDELIGRLRGFQDVWLATCAELAEHADRTLGIAGRG
jgi:peptidoglycan-N-acetylglucosamine deacetylase